MKIGDVSFFGLFPIITFTLALCIMTMVRSLYRTQYSLHRIVGAAMTISAAVCVALEQALRWRQFDNNRLGVKDMTTLSGFVSTDRLSALSVGVLSLLVVR